MAYEYKVTKTYNYKGAPQNESHYKIENRYFIATVKHYGNQGFDVPQITCLFRSNGYFWCLHTFMRAFYQDKLRGDFFGLKLNETKVIKLEHYQY